MPVLNWSSSPVLNRWLPQIMKVNHYNMPMPELHVGPELWREILQHTAPPVGRGFVVQVGGYRIREALQLQPWEWEILVARGEVSDADGEG
jgi:hypothetical protein